MNNENNWKECKENNKAIQKTPDNQKAKSLKKTAQGRIEFLKEHTITPKNANYLFEGYYTSTLELLHAHLARKGYDVKNHLCIAHYIKEELQREDLHRTFDNCRYKRNKLQYYGQEMNEETAKQAIQECKRLIEEIKKLE